MHGGGSVPTLTAAMRQPLSVLIIARNEEANLPDCLHSVVGWCEQVLVVLDTLSPAERLAFVLHDLFDLPFDEIGPIVGRSSSATRQLASRARRRVRGTPTPPTDLPRQRRVVDAYLAAVRDGDFEGLLRRPSHQRSAIVFRDR